MQISNDIVKSVLIIGDEPLFIDEMKTVLTHNKYRVQTAKSGLDVAIKFKLKNFDIVIIYSLSSDLLDSDKFIFESIRKNCMTSTPTIISISDFNHKIQNYIDHNLPEPLPIKDLMNVLNKLN